MTFKVVDMNIIGEVVVVTRVLRFICSMMFICLSVNIIATILNDIAG